MKRWFFGLLLLVCTPAHAQEPPVVPTIVWIADGADARISTSSTAPSGWFNPATTVTWATLPAGFGPRLRFAEVSTVSEFQEIRLRQTFDFATPSDTLTLSLKHQAAALDVYLNGQSVLSLAATALPPADASGFRHYDLSPHIGMLPAAGNLLALHVRGNIAVPILHGTTNQIGLSSIGIDPTATRLPEGGGPLRFRVFRNESATSARIELSGVGGTATALSDFSIRQNGTPVGITAPVSGSPYFLATFSGTETSLVYEITALDDAHAEAKETFTLKPVLSSSPISCEIPFNDVLVSRTASSGEGSLRQAIENAERLPGLETIGFSQEEGVPFHIAPITVALESGSSGANGLSEGFTLEGPSSPGRVTIQTSGSPLFYIAGGSGAASTQNLTLRRLVIAGSSLAVSSLRYNGTMLIEGCEFIGSGKALDLYGINSAPVIRRCLFSGSSTAIRSTSGLPPLIENCTFVSGGTCLEFSNAPTVVHCTFTGNPLRIASGTARFRNCLLTAETSDIKLINTDFDQGGNLFAGVLQAGKPVAAKHPDSLAIPTSSAARLGELGTHGGFTRSIPILADSPALDLGILSPTLPPQSDQRGTPYLRRVGPAPDAGAYELQINASDLVIGLQTDPQYDPISRLYFQFVLVHNTTPWTLSGFRLRASILPSDATLYNASGDGYLDVAGPIPPAEYRVVILQYQAPRPDLRLLVSLNLDLLPGSDLPQTATTIRIPILECMVKPNASPRLRFPTEAGGSYQIQISDDLLHWQPAGPTLRSESDLIEWTDPDPAPPKKRWYRIADPGN